jgi:hypothetical protein
MDIGGFVWQLRGFGAWSVADPVRGALPSPHTDSQPNLESQSVTFFGWGVPGLSGSS